MRMKIVGTGSASPEKCVDNFQLESLLDTTDEWIRERTGIEMRRISTGETVPSLAAEACQKALDQAGRKAEEVDLILAATCTSELLFPCCACQVQDKIGAVNAVAFDINAACSGFLFGVITAHAYMQTGRYRRILVVGSEVLSRIMDWSDRSTCVLFGDGAGAVLIEACEDGDSDLLGAVQGADGSRGMVLHCKGRNAKTPFLEEEEGEIFTQMDGRAVYGFATRQVSACIKEALDQAGLSAGDIDLFILHQANIRIIQSVAKHLGAEMDKFPLNIQRYGNTSSATIPILLDELNREGKLRRGDKIVLSGFGAGLTYGACVLRW